MSGITIVFLGGGIGSVARFLVGRAAAMIGTDFPWSTMMINITGSLAMGFVVGWFSTKMQGGHQFKLFLTTGLLGGFTTYSTFSLEAATLWQRGDITGAFLYIAGSLILGLAGIFGGLALSHRL